MKKFRAAVIPGDGIGKEVMPEGVKVLDVVVGQNLLGDILSDLGPVATGTIRIAPSANLD